MVSYSPNSTHVDFIWTHPADIDGNFMETCDPAMAAYSPATSKLTDDCWLLQWSAILQKAPLTPKIPVGAKAIHTPTHSCPLATSTGELQPLQATG